PGGARAFVVVVAPQRAKGCTRRIVRRQRRAQPLHPAPFLIDEYRRIGPPDAIAHRSDQIADLLRLADVAGKQDETPWTFAAIEADFVPAERFPGTTQDHGF